MAKPFRADDWYWFVGGDETRAYSSAAGDYVAAGDATFLAWQADGGAASRIASEIELGAVLADARVRPQNAAILDSFKGRHADELTVEVTAKLFFQIVNEIRDIKGQAPVTAAQFRNYVKGLM